MANTTTTAAARPSLSRIVVVEDEDDVRILLDFNLQAAGFEVISLPDGAGAPDVIAREQATLVIVDRLFPRGDGLEVCRQIRSDSRLVDIGILILSARGSEQDRLDGFAAGADDYVVKPFSVREVVARARVLTSAVEDRRRARSFVDSAAGTVHRWRNVVIDLERHRIFTSGVEVELRPLEFKVLRALLQTPEKIWTREEILGVLWGDEVTASRRSIDVHIRRLRERLGPFGEIVETVRGVGYRLRAE